MGNALQGTFANQQVAGGFRVFVSPPGGKRIEITMFRGVPVVPTQWSWGDPYSEGVAVLDCPMITPWDTLGYGDVYWVVEGADVDIIWQPSPGSPITQKWSWEGFITSIELGISGGTASFQIQLRGNQYALDNFLALPIVPEYPLPYEFLLRSAFDPEEHPCSLNPLAVEFPTWWNTFAAPPTPGENQLLRPAGVVTGSMWTGLTQRSTGSWNPMLTGFVTSLLQNMWNADGSQWTIINRGNRSPLLKVREQASNSDPKVLNVDLGAPGVDVQLSMDYTQMANVIYGTGTDTTGVNYSGMQMSSDGTSLNYIPFAFNPAAFPRKGNPLYNPQRKVRETYAQFQQGLTQIAAQQVAQGQLQRLNDPGMTGTITLTSDPYLSDGANTPYLRLLIKAGQSIRVNGLLGVPEGVLFHISEADIDGQGLTASLTVDTKYRDLLTVNEVNARTHDPLALLHQIQSTSQSNLIQDLLLPWSYVNGSGSIPYPATAFYNSMPSTEAFPYSNDLTVAGNTKGWAQLYPPKNFPEYYVRIPPTDRKDSSNNWANYGVQGGTPGQAGIPILMSSVGTASQIQVGAYDKDGNVMPVKFHISFYQSSGVSPQDMPLWMPNPYLPAVGGHSPYPPMLGPQDYNSPESAEFSSRWSMGSGDASWSGSAVGNTNFPWWNNTADPVGAKNYIATYHPFFQGAWQTVDEQGHSFQVTNGSGNTEQYAPLASAQQVVGWGTYHVPAGFWPGQVGGGSPTGLLVDNESWSWNTTGTLNSQSATPVAATQVVGGPANAGRLFAMIYCEDQGNKDVFFLGRIFGKSQDGQSGG